MTKRNVIILFIMVGLAAGAAGWLSAHWLAARIQLDRATARLHDIQLAVERYAVDHQGRYPATLADAEAAGALPAMPENPYTKEPMPVLAPGDPPVAGGVVYVPAGPVLTPVPRPADELVPVAGDYDQYFLLVYGEEETADATPPSLPPAVATQLAQVDWPRAALVLTEGKD